MKISPIFFVILVLFSAGCNHTERDTVAPAAPTVMQPEAQASPAATPSPAATAAPDWMTAGATNRVADIIGAPNAFIGKTVTIVADVDEVYGPRAFTLDVEDVDSSGARSNDDDDLLTLIPKVGGFPSVEPQWEDYKARVTGVVQRLTPKDIEREIGWSLPSNLESSFRGKPVLIVRSIERLAD